MTSELQQTNYTVPWSGEYCSVYAYQLRLDLKFGLSFSFQITKNSFRLGYYRRRRVELQNQTLYRDKIIQLQNQTQYHDKIIELQNQTLHRDKMKRSGESRRYPSR